MMKNKRFAVAVGLVCLAVVSRLVPHYPNFTALGAMALFSGAALSKRLWAFALPLLAFWISDLFLNNIIYSQYMDGFTWFTPGFAFQAIAVMLIVFLGRWVSRKQAPGRIVLGSVLAAVVFFLISNFGVWLSGTMYPHNFSGLLEAYIAGLPFALKGTLGSTLFYSAVLFGVYYYVTRPVSRVAV